MGELKNARKKNSGGRGTQKRENEPGGPRGGRGGGSKGDPGESARARENCQGEAQGIGQPCKGGNNNLKLENQRQTKTRKKSSF